MNKIERAVQMKDTERASQFKMGGAKSNIIFVSGGKCYESRFDMDKDIENTAVYFSKVDMTNFPNKIREVAKKSKP